MTYNDKHLSQNQIERIGEFDTLEEAKESDIIYQAFVDGTMIAECYYSANQFAEQNCYDKINDYMSKLDSSIYPIETWVEADAKEVDGSRELWSYDFDKDKWEAKDE